MSTLIGKFEALLKRFPEKEIFFKSEAGRWIGFTVKQSWELAERWARALIQAGVQEGEAVVLLMENSPEWFILDLGNQMARARTVSIYPNSSLEDLAHILADCDAKVAAVELAHLGVRIAPALSKAKNIQRIINLSAESGGTEGISVPIQRLTEFLDSAKPATEDELWLRRGRVVPDDVVSLVYTSGTSGQPKGVMLTHDNFVSNCEGATASYEFNANDVNLCFLPLSHVFSRMTTYTQIHAGVQIYCARDINLIARMIVEIRPSILIIVPRVAEKLWSRIQSKMSALTGFRSFLAKTAFKVGVRRIKQYEGERILFLDRLLIGIFDRLVFTKIRENLGGRLRLISCGGAPLNPEIAREFCAMGLPIMEGYGLTETSPVIAANTSRAFRVGTVGRPFPGISVKIAPDGEILTRGRHVMKGYYKLPNDTKEVIDAEGYFHTGDVGVLDANGFLEITDRKKDIIITAGGKNVAPQKIEAKLVESPLIDQVCVLGDKRPYLVAMVVANLEECRRQLNALGLNDADCRPLIEKELNRVNQELGHYETIKRFVLLEDPFSIEQGELTPTLKIRRKVVQNKFKDRIDALYKAS